MFEYCGDHKEDFYKVVCGEIKQKKFNFAINGIQAAIILLQNFGVKELNYMNSFYTNFEYQA